MNKLFEKGCNLINYKTYNNIRNSLLISGLASNIALLSFPETIGNYMCFVSWPLYLSYMYLLYNKGEIYTKDVNELRSLYNEFISNYNKMNRDFSNNEPISIYTMFYYLVTNGYLSMDKSFENNNNCCDLRSLMGADIFFGNGVCRHLSSMLSDILNDYGIPSINTVCYAINSNFAAIPIKRENYSREENIAFISKYIKDLTEREKMIERLVLLEENEIYLRFECVHSDIKDKKLQRVGNHLITYSLCDDKSYYLDSTSFMIYRVKDFKRGIVGTDDINIHILRNQFYRMNEISDKEIKKFVGYMEKYQDSVSLSEEDRIISSTLDICDENLDIFDKFYDYNKELYGEIANKLGKIKKRKR